MDDSKYSLDELLKPVSLENPCGIDISYDQDFLQIKSLIKESENFDKGIWKEKNKKEINFHNLLDNCCQIFIEKSKNITILICIFEIRFKIYGLFGLYESLELLKLFLDKYWEELNKNTSFNNEIDLAIFLDKKLEYNLRTGVLFNGIKNIENFDYNNCLDYIKNKKIIDKSFLRELNIDDMSNDLNRCILCLNTLSNFFNKVNNNNEVYFLKSIEVLENICKLFIVNDLDDISYNQTTNEDKYSINTINSNEREGIYQQIFMLSEKLLIIEPHSPVPLLIKRALDCKNKNFVEILNTFFSSSQEIRYMIGNFFGNNNSENED